MSILIHFATLALITIFAAATALALDWMLLRAMFLLMQPATARRAVAPANLVRGTARITQAYASHR